MNTLLEALKDLKEDVEQEENKYSPLELPCTEEEYLKAKERYAQASEEMKNLAKEKSWGELQNLPEYKELKLETSELYRVISVYENAVRWNKALESEHIATKDEWDDFFDEMPCPDQLEYSDLGVEVEREWEEETWHQATSGDWIQSCDGGTGYFTVDDWTYSYELDPDDLENFVKEKLNKPVEKITNTDLLAMLDEEADFYEWLCEFYRDSAELDAEENWEPDSDDWDSGSW